MLIGARLGLVILASVLCNAAALAQQPATTTQPAIGRIELDVVVTGKSGPPVTGLQQQDFTLLDNKAPRTTTSFKAITGREAGPLEVVVVIDAVNTNVQQVSYERIQINKFLRADEGRLAYPVALALFTDQGIRAVSDFSSDGNALSAWLFVLDTWLHAKLLEELAKL